MVGAGTCQRPGLMLRLQRCIRASRLSQKRSAAWYSSDNGFSFLSPLAGHPSVASLSLTFRDRRLRCGVSLGVRVKGMRYPCPPPPEEDETASVAKRTSAVGRYGSESLPAVPVEERSGRGGLGGVSDKKDSESGQCLVESQLRGGLAALLKVLASYEYGNPLPDGSRALDDTLGRESDGDDRGREPPLMSQVSETADKIVSKTNGSGRAVDNEQQDSPPPSYVGEGKQNTAATKRPSVENISERDGDEGGMVPSRSASASHSSAPPSTSPRKSSGSLGNASSPAGCPTPSKSDTSPEEVHSSCRTKSMDLIAGPSEHAVESSDEQDNFTGHMEDSGSTEGKRDAPGPSPATKKTDETVGRIHGGTRVCAADLEAASKEGERLAGLAAEACEQLEEEEASLIR